MDRLRKVLVRPTAPLVVGILFGVSAAWVLVGAHAIYPADVKWVFGDDATYYSGWEQYRRDPHLHFPLSWTERIGYPVGTSIALLDAIPIAAVLLRPLSAFLPEPFQYLGLWMLLSLVLQAYFGFSLLRRLFPADPLFALIGSVFLLIPAPLAYRLCGHIALSSQWLILAGLDAYFRDPGARPARWLCRPWILLALAAAINPYLAAMCLLIVLGCVVRLAIERRSTWWQAAFYAAVTFVVVSVSGATLGVLVSGDVGTYRAGGYGRFSLNLNAPINPMGFKSLLLPELSLAYPQQIDGYSYLGLGIIGLLLVGLLRRPKTVLWLSQTRLAAIVGVAAACTMLAISTDVTFGAHLLLTIPLPAAVDSALQGLRASGRLFWPAFYLISVAALSLTFWTLNPSDRLAILTAALALQVADLLPLYAQSRSRCDGRFDTPLTSPAWSGLGRRFDNLILIPPYQCDPTQAAGGLYNYVYFGRLAAIEHLRLNNYYAARYTHAELRAHCVDLLRAQLLGDLDPRSAYVVSDNVLTVCEVHGVPIVASVWTVSTCARPYRDTTGAIHRAPLPRRRTHSTPCSI